MVEIVGHRKVGQPVFVEVADGDGLRRLPSRDFQLVEEVFLRKCRSTYSNCKEKNSQQDAGRRVGCGFQGVTPVRTAERTTLPLIDQCENLRRKSTRVVSRNLYGANFFPERRGLRRLVRSP